MQNILSKKGVLPSQSINELIKQNRIKGSVFSNIQPASLDLSLSGEAYRINSVFLPDPGESIRKAMKVIGAEPFDIKNSLEIGVSYIFCLNESLDLPNGIYGYSNPKSSMGRLDTHARMLADGISRFDSAGISGYKGELWVILTPRSFRVKFNKGDKIIQIRFFTGDTRLSGEDEFGELYYKHKMLFDSKENFIEYSRIKMKDNDGGLILSLDLNLDIAGYRGERNHNVLDFSKKGFYNIEDFFQPIPKPKNGYIILRKGDFYIFASKEFLRVPPDLSAEMNAIDHRSGEFRAHYAGFFDPGFGHGRGEVKGCRAVLEVRSNEDDIKFKDGQPICKMIFERMIEIPDIIYGDKELGSNYDKQTNIKLSKHFK